ncbi:MAG TPA: hypothetical protein PK210_04880 [Bacteroidia bacterium]|nr:hypothetical protein [Bacteroidia bacterium]
MLESKKIKPEIIKRLGLLNADEAAVYLGFTRGRFNQICKNLGKAYANGVKYYTVSELDNWVIQHFGIANLAQTV